jgi:hypothetical protein
MRSPTSSRRQAVEVFARTGDPDTLTAVLRAAELVETLGDQSLVPWSDS